MSDPCTLQEEYSEVPETPSEQLRARRVEIFRRRMSHAYQIREAGSRFMEPYSFRYYTAPSREIVREAAELDDYVPRRTMKIYNTPEGPICRDECGIFLPDESHEFAKPYVKDPPKPRESLINLVIHHHEEAKKKEEKEEAPKTEEGDTQILSQD